MVKCPLPFISIFNDIAYMFFLRPQIEKLKFHFTFDTGKRTQNEGAGLESDKGIFADRRR